MADSGSKLSSVSVWALAAGGMVGGGIYTVLGVVIAVSAQWAWLAFAFTGVIALCSAYSYVFLSNTYNEGGGAFDFLEKVNDDWLGGSLGWMLILGYVLTISVYAYAFGHYVAFAFHGGGLVIRGLAAGIVAVLIGLNLAGAGKLTKVEIGIVSVNLLILLGLGVYGLTQWDTTQLTAGVEPRPAWSGLIGGAAIFMAYEGFQLLSYEYDRIREPHKNFMPTLMSAVVFVVLLYIVVALGATFIGGAATLIDFKEIALSITAQKAFGETGLIVMTLAAGFATAAAINSTLFSTANLTKKIAGKGLLFGIVDCPPAPAPLSVSLPEWRERLIVHNVRDQAVRGNLRGDLVAAYHVDTAGGVAGTPCPSTARAAHYFRRLSPRKDSRRARRSGRRVCSPCFSSPNTKLCGQIPAPSHS